MKKSVLIIIVLIAAALVFGCRTYDKTVNRVGWSSYSDISVKDYTVAGIISLESQEVYSYGPFGFKKTFKGSRIVWSDLMAEAAKLGADDVINVRIEETNYNVRKGLGGNMPPENAYYTFFYQPSIIEFFTGYSVTWKYKATALAINYTNPIDRQKSERMDNLKGQDKK